MRSIIKIAVSGAAGRIAYSLLPRLAAGEVFGKDQKIELRLLETSQMLAALNGIEMEMRDCTFDLMTNIVITDKAEIAFEDVDFALLVGAKPRSQGMERSDLLRINGPIFREQGKILGEKAAEGCEVIVVGNPANTNCLIAKHHAKSRRCLRFSALTRLDQNRAVSMLAAKCSVAPHEVKNVIIWGNHSATQFPDVSEATIKGRPIIEMIEDQVWLQNEFIKNVQERGSAVLKASGVSSALSAAQAICDHIRSMTLATPEKELFSAAIASDGSYGVDEGLIFSFSVRKTVSGSLEIVKNLARNEFAKEKIKITLEELRREREAVQDFLL